MRSLPLLLSGQSAGVRSGWLGVWHGAGVSVVLEVPGFDPVQVWTRGGTRNVLVRPGASPVVVDTLGRHPGPVLPWRTAAWIPVNVAGIVCMALAASGAGPGWIVNTFDQRGSIAPLVVWLVAAVVLVMLMRTRAAHRRDYAALVASAHRTGTIIDPEQMRDYVGIVADVDAVRDQITALTAAGEVEAAGDVRFRLQNLLTRLFGAYADACRCEGVRGLSGPETADYERDRAALWELAHPSLL